MSQLVNFETKTLRWVWLGKLSTNVRCRREMFWLKGCNANWSNWPGLLWYLHFPLPWEYGRGDPDSSSPQNESACKSTQTLLWSNIVKSKWLSLFRLFSYEQIWHVYIERERDTESESCFRSAFAVFYRHILWCVFFPVFPLPCAGRHLEGSCAWGEGWHQPGLQWHSSFSAPQQPQMERFIVFRSVWVRIIQKQRKVCIFYRW